MYIKDREDLVHNARPAATGVPAQKRTRSARRALYRKPRTIGLLQFAHARTAETGQLARLAATFPSDAAFASHITGTAALGTE